MLEIPCPKECNSQQADQFWCGVTLPNKTVHKSNKSLFEAEKTGNCKDAKYSLTNKLFHAILETGSRF